MTIIYSVTPTAGINLNTTVPSQHCSSNDAILYPDVGPLGLQVFGSDGKRYVLAKVTSSIGNDTACIINTSTFVATANDSGTYVSPSVDLVTGEFAWFGKASV